MILTVSQLNTYLEKQFFSDTLLSKVTVHGEVVNLNRKYSLVFLSLKDCNSSIDAYIPDSELIKNIDDLEEGADIVATGSVGIYQKSGKLRLCITSFDFFGEGAYIRKLEKLKKKLAAEGLFDNKFKKELPVYPEKIGIITSLQGAAIRDIVNVSNRRNPYVQLCICPSKVQGEGAAAEMAENLQYLNSRKDISVIIIGRGGGSMLDLDPFNDELLVREIFNSKIPVVSAVGHETDFTLCDIVSDLRAPTPSAAAELVVPDAAEITNKLNFFSNTFIECLNNKISAYGNNIEKFRYALSDVFIGNKINTCADTLSLYADRFYDILKDRISVISTELTGYSLALNTMNPKNILDAGYAFIEKNGTKIHSVSDVSINEIIEIKIKGGSITAKITGKDKFSE